jgi:hypothetical protein
MATVQVTRGDPTDEEVAAIVAAAALVWPRPVVGTAASASSEPDRWRFSGRWWSKPVPIRRDRPLHYQ